MDIFNNQFYRSFIQNIKLSVESLVIFETTSLRYSGYFVTKNDLVYGFLEQESNDNTQFFIMNNLCNINVKEFHITSLRMYAITNSYRVYYWDTQKNEPQQFNYFKSKSERILEISGGLNHTLFRTNKGSLYGWGSNIDHHQLSQNKTKNYKNPLKMFNAVKNYQNIKYIFCYENSSFAITKNQKVYFWGLNRWNLNLEKVNLNGFMSKLITDIKANKLVANEEGVYYLHKKMINKYGDPSYPKSLVNDLAIGNGNSILLLGNNQVIQLKGNTTVLTEYKTFNHYFLSTFGTTHSTFIYDKENVPFNYAVKVGEHPTLKQSNICKNMERIHFNDEGYQSMTDDMSIKHKWLDLIKKGIIF